MLHAGTDHERALLRAGADEEPPQESVLAAARALGLAPRAVVFFSLASLVALFQKAIKESSVTTVTAFVVAPLVVVGAVSAVTIAVVAGRGAAHAPMHAAAPPAPQGAALPILVPPAVSAAATIVASPAETAPVPVQAKKIVGAAPRGSQDGDLAEQVRLVDRARGLVAAGDAAGALAAVDAYEHRFGHGILAEEAALVRIQATQARGEHAEAAALARRFLAQYPESVHRSKVQWLLGDGTK